MTDDERRADVGGGKLSRAVVQMPRWKRKLLATSLTLAVIGGGVKATTSVLAGRASAERANATSTAPPAAGQRSADGTVLPENASGFASGNRSGAAEPAPAPTFTEKTSGWLFKLALSVFVGVVVGTVFRMFIKTMAVIAALVLGTIVALSYFNVLNVDFTTMKHNYDSAAGWATGQAGKLKDALMATLPSTGAAAAGFFLGFRR